MRDADAAEHRGDDHRTEQIAPTHCSSLRPARGCLFSGRAVGPVGKHTPAISGTPPKPAELSNKSAVSPPRVAGTVLALPSIVRATRSGAEHTTVAVRIADDAGPTVTLIVPGSGFDLVAVERALIRFALESHDGNRTHAAEFLGLSRSALLYRMQKYGLAVPVLPPAGSGEHS